MSEWKNHNFSDFALINPAISLNGNEKYSFVEMKELKNGNKCCSLSTKRNTGNSHILLFDGVCNLCNGIVQFIIKRDPKGKFKFASLQSESGQALLKKGGLPTDSFDSFVFIHDDKYILKSSAALRVLKELGGFWKLFYFFIIIPRPLRDVVYNLIAKKRYSIFGKRHTCMIPTQAIKQRFLP